MLYWPTRRRKKRSVNKGLDGYKKPPAKTILYCKAKISVPQNESPTQKLRTSSTTVLTTLLKIDTSAKIFKYKDKTNMSFINHPDQIPETPSKIKEFFHGRYRPNAKAMTIWPDIKVGFNIPEDIFLKIAPPYSVKKENLDYTGRTFRLKRQRKLVFCYFHPVNMINVDFENQLLRERKKHVISHLSYVYDGEKLQTQRKCADDPKEMQRQGNQRKHCTSKL